MGVVTYWYCAECQREFSVDQEPMYNQQEAEENFDIKNPESCPFCGAKNLESRNE